MSATFNYEPIGIIHTPFQNKDGMPIQSIGAKGIKGSIILDKKFKAGLEDLDGFSHIYLIYHFHKSDSYKLKTKPFLDDKLHGVFATRAPQRPNSIGVSVVKLIEIRDNFLAIENVDVLDGTPLLDIKPYIPDFDFHEVEKTGWTSDKTRHIERTKSDNRFTEMP